jgi:hypothetical protein
MVPFEERIAIWQEHIERLKAERAFFSSKDAPKLFDASSGKTVYMIEEIRKATERLIDMYERLIAEAERDTS